MSKFEVEKENGARYGFLLIGFAIGVFLTGFYYGIFVCPMQSDSTQKEELTFLVQDLKSCIVQNQVLEKVIDDFGMNKAFEEYINQRVAEQVQVEEKNDSNNLQVFNFGNNDWYCNVKEHYFECWESPFDYNHEQLSKVEIVQKDPMQKIEPDYSSMTEEEVRQDTEKRLLNHLYMFNFEGICVFNCPFDFNSAVAFTDCNVSFQQINEKCDTNKIIEIKEK